MWRVRRPEGQPKAVQITSATTAITVAATNTMSVRRATRLRFGLNPMPPVSPPTSPNRCDRCDGRDLDETWTRPVRPGRDRPPVPSLTVARTNRLFLLAGAALVVWYVVVIVWAVRPLSDSVPIGLDPDGRPMSQTVECRDLFAGTSTDGALPIVAAPNEYTRGACSAVQRDARLVFGLDTAAFVLGVAALVVARRRAHRFAADEGSVVVTA